MMKSFIFLTVLFLFHCFIYTEQTLKPQCPLHNSCSHYPCGNCPNENDICCADELCDYDCVLYDDYFGCYNPEDGTDDCIDEDLCCYIPELRSMQCIAPVNGGKIQNYFIQLSLSVGDTIVKGACPNYDYCDPCEGCSEICCFDSNCQISCISNTDDFCFDDEGNDLCEGEQMCCYSQDECRHKCMDPIYYKDVCPEPHTLVSGEFAHICESEDERTVCNDYESCCETECPDVEACTEGRKIATCPDPVSETCTSVSCIDDVDCIDNDELCCPVSESSDQCCTVPEFVYVDYPPYYYF